MKRILHRRKRNEPRENGTRKFQNQENPETTSMCRLVRKFSDLKSSPIMMPLALTEYFRILLDVSADQCQSSTPSILVEKQCYHLGRHFPRRDHLVHEATSSLLFSLSYLRSCGVYRDLLSPYLASFRRQTTFVTRPAIPPFPFSPLSLWKAPRIYAYILVIRKNPLSSPEYHLLGLLLETARIEPFCGEEGRRLAYLNAQL